VLATSGSGTSRSFYGMLQAFHRWQRCVSAPLDRVSEVTRMNRGRESMLGQAFPRETLNEQYPCSRRKLCSDQSFAELRHYGDQKYRLELFVSPTRKRAGSRQWLASVRDKLSPDCIANTVSLSQQSGPRRSLLCWLRSVHARRGDRPVS